MRVKNSWIVLDKDDSLTVEICGGEESPKLTIGISNTNIMVCNECEERIYLLKKTKVGGFKLKEGELG